MAGSKRQVAAGRWELRVYLGRDPVTGRKRQRSRTFHGGARAADRALAKMVTDLGVDRTAPTAATLNDLLARWMPLVWRDRSPTTANGYESIIRRHLAPTIGATALGKLRADQLDALYQHLADQGLAAATVTRVHAVISSALTQGTKWGWVDQNVARLATPPSAGHHEPTLPAPDVIHRLALAAAERDPDFATLIGVKLKLACRRGEVCGLQWGDVDLERGVVRIRRAVVEVRGQGLAVKDTKTHAVRVMAIDDATVAALTAHRVRAEERAGWAEVELGPGSFVFSRDPSGASPLRPGSVTQTWRRLCKREGVQGVRLHDLRHLHASVLIDAGVALPTVSARLGHRDQTTTANIYAHVLPASDRAAADIAGRLL